MLQPIIFFFKNLNPAKCNYKIYDKELLAITRCFELWKPELEETRVPIKVITDYKSLEYFITTKKLTKHQACKAKFLSSFNFVISYTLGKKNQKADLLTRCLNNLLSSENNNYRQHQLETFLPAKGLEISSITKGENTTIIRQIVKANLEDDYCSKQRYSLKTSYLVKKIDSCHVSHLSVDLKNCIC